VDKWRKFFKFLDVCAVDATLTYVARAKTSRTKATQTGPGVAVSGVPRTPTEKRRASARTETLRPSRPPPSTPPRSSRRATLAPKPVAPKKPDAPEECLARALAAETPRSRAIWARRGLAARARLDRTTQAMLLRQLYLAHFEQRQFREAALTVEQSLPLGILEDVLHQDAARAAFALGDVEGAARHLRTAARLGPASRRAFHWWTLGSLLFVAGRHRDAVGALSRAARWGVRDKPLYEGHLALARLATGERVRGLGGMIKRLTEVPAGQGYGRFVLGLLAFHHNRLRDARGHLETFLSRTSERPPVFAIALDGECRHAERVLAEIVRGLAVPGQN
jgi:tetratricopeptide (TPR) repeat protein